jgi:hypothetical protein
MPKSSIPLSEWSGSGATHELHETIKQYVTIAEQQTRAMIRLTWTITALTVVMIGEAGWQIWLLSHTP